MKKIVNEIIDNNRELEKDKKKLNEVVKVLEKNNPKILPSKEFRKHLKNKLNSIISLKQGNKNTFMIWAMPVFSFIFIVSGFIYFYNDIVFFGKDEKIYELEEYPKEEIDLELESLLELFEESKEEENIEETIQESLVEENPMETKSLKKNLIEDESIENDISDDVLIEIFDGLDADIQEEYNNTMENEASTMSSFSIESDSSVDIDFLAFCKQEKGELTGTGFEEKCIIDKKECYSRDFVNGVCEFNEIK